MYQRKHNTRPMSAVGRSWGPSLVSDSERITMHNSYELPKRTYRHAFLKQTPLRASTSNSDISEDETAQQTVRRKKMMPSQKKVEVAATPKITSSMANHVKQQHTGNITKKQYSAANHKMQRNLQFDSSVASTSRENLSFIKGRHSNDNSIIDSQGFKVPKSGEKRPRRQMSPEYRSKSVKVSKPLNDYNEQTMETEVESDAGRAIQKALTSKFKTIIIREKVHVKDASTQAGSQDSKETQTDMTGNIAVASSMVTPTTEQDNDNKMVLTGENNIKALIKLISRNTSISRHNKPAYDIKNIAKKLTTLTGISITQDWVKHSFE